MWYLAITIWFIGGAVAYVEVPMENIVICMIAKENYKASGPNRAILRKEENCIIHTDDVKKDG